MKLEGLTDRHTEWTAAESSGSGPDVPTPFVVGSAVADSLMESPAMSYPPVVVARPGFNTPYCLSVYEGNVVIMVHGQRDTDVLTDIINDFNILSFAKVNWNKREAILVGGWTGGDPKLPDNLSWKTGGFKYLGVYLGGSDYVKKTWEGTLEKVKGCLNKWKWLILKHHIEEELLIKNLAASALWQTLACTDPPLNLLANLQAKLVDVFWDNLNWIPQSILYLSMEDSGHGLVVQKNCSFSSPVYTETPHWHREAFME